MKEVCAGDLSDFFSSHGISGQLCFIDQSTLVIRNFNYDGRGPGTLFYHMNHKIILVCCNIINAHIHTHTSDAFLYWYPIGHDPPYTAENVQTEFASGGGYIIPHPET